MALKIIPYGPSDSAKALADLLGAKRVKSDSTSYVPRHFDQIINWGCARSPVWQGRAEARSVRVLNNSIAVNKAANKLTTFQILTRAGIAMPEFTTDISVAQNWLHSGATVMERHELRGNSGAGIRIVNLDDPDMNSNLLAAPLYTKFINKSTEFRVHVFNGQVIDYIEKKKVPSDRRPANFNRYISSLSCGWVFTRSNISNIAQVREQAIRSVNALGLDFGAVDIVFYNGNSYVLEVNSSPGLKGTTLVAYANAINRWLGKPNFTPAQVAHLIDQPSSPVQQAQPAAVFASVRVQPNSDLVTLTMNRTMARELRALLAGI